jgi:alkylation response protein AidB-like acyl-CoA dehydrogenase
MRFSLQEDQTILSDQIRQFASQELTLPHQGLSNSEVQARLTAITEQGIMGLSIPESHGGPGVDHITLARCVMALAETDASLATIVALTNGCVVEALLLSENHPAQNTRLEAIMTGEARVAWCGGHMGEARPIAKPTETGWLLSGTCPTVPLATQATAFLVCANSDDGPLLFWLPRETQGLDVTPIERPLGLRHASSGTVQLNDAKADQTTQLLPASGDGASFLQQLLARGNTLLAGVATGTRQAALDVAANYAQERKQFGKPISAFQAIQWKLADMAMEQEACRLLFDRAAHAWATNDEAALQEWSAAAFSKAAAFAPFAGQEAIQIHGGYGFTTEFPVERLYRDANALRARFFHPETANDTLAPSTLHHH